MFFSFCTVLLMLTAALSQCTVVLALPEIQTDLEEGWCSGPADC
jgi:hypothetical protein